MTAARSPNPALGAALYTDAHCLEHQTPGHPERPERLSAALRGVEGLGLAQPAVRPADESLLRLAHTDAHVRRVRALAANGGGWLDPDTYVVPASFEAACYAAGAVVQATSDVLAGRVRSAFVIARPPGHHALPQQGMGFCLFNNVAIGAEWALTSGGAERVAVLDIDVHHGNGTQQVFYERADVLYCSVHQYPFYPGTGALSEMGDGAGRGATINVPLMAGCGDATYRQLTDRVLGPVLERFQPDCVLVSLGFDAHWADPLAGMRVSVQGYGDMLARILEAANLVCGGRAVFLLEGGYDLHVLEEGCRLAASLLLGRPVPADRLGPAVGSEPPAAQALLDAVCEAHRL